MDPKITPPHPELSHDSVATQPTKNNKLLFVMLGVLTLVVIIGTGLFLIKSQKKQTSNNVQSPRLETRKKTELNPSPSADEFLKWKTYSNSDFGISFNMPESYKVLSENEDEIQIGWGIDRQKATTYLIISKSKFTPYGTYINCNQSMKDENDLPLSIPCLAQSDQKPSVSDYVLDKVPAKNIYIWSGIDNSYEIIQTVSAPKIELKMYIAGGGLERDFSKILSTFKFNNQLLTYSYSQIGFEVQYPSTWAITHESKQQGEYPGFQLNLTRNDTTIYFDFTSGGNMICKFPGEPEPKQYSPEVRCDTYEVVPHPKYNLRRTTEDGHTYNVMQKKDDSPYYSTAQIFFELGSNDSHLLKEIDEIIGSYKRENAF